MRDKKMKILLISVDPSNATGGIATWTRGYLDYCNKNNVSCDLVDIAKNSQSHIGLVNEIIRTCKIVSRLKKRISVGSHYDIAHLNSSIGTYGVIRDYFLAKKIKKKKIPLVVHFHCDVEYWDKRGIVQYFLRKLLRISDYRIVLCQSSKNHLKEIYDANSIIIPNYIDRSSICNSRKINDAMKTVIYTGRVSEAKGCIELFQLAKRFPYKLFLLVGKIYINPSDFSIPSNVSLLGEMSHDQVLNLLDEADVFVFPSHSEGFSIALTEAMGKGLPSIVTDVGANRDMVSGGAGIVVPVSDIDKMELALKAMEDQKIRKQMSDKAVDKVKKEYVIASVMENFILLYQGIIDNGSK